MPLLTLQYREQLPHIVGDELEQLVSTLQEHLNGLEGWGKWQDIPYAASDYSSPVGLWTVRSGEARLHRYCLVANIMQFQVRLIGTTTDAAVGNVLRVRIPNGYRTLSPDNALIDFLGPVQANWTGNSLMGFAFIDPLSPFHVRLVRDVLSPSTAWPTVTNDLTIGLNLTIPVARDDAQE